MTNAERYYEPRHANVAYVDHDGRIRNVQHPARQPVPNLIPRRRVLERNGEFIAAILGAVAFGLALGGITVIMASGVLL